jgi:hypothetical protein
VRGDGGFGKPNLYQVSERLEIAHTFGISTDPVLQRASEGLLAEAVRLWGEARQPQRLFDEPALPVGGLLAAERRAAARPGAPPGPVVGRGDDDGVVRDAEAVELLQRLADVIVVGVARPAGRSGAWVALAALADRSPSSIQTLSRVPQPVRFGFAGGRPLCHHHNLADGVPA